MACLQEPYVVVVPTDFAKFPKVQESPDNVEALQAWRSITFSLSLEEVDSNELCTEFAMKARYDGTKIVLVPEAVRHIIEKFKMKGLHCVPNLQPHVQREQRHRRL